MTQNADYLCRYCGDPIEVQESGQWGHIRLRSRMLRFWCGHVRVEPTAANLTAAGVKKIVDRKERT